MKLHHQVTGATDRLFERLNELLSEKGLRRVRFTVAYARWGGIGLISKELEAFLTRGGAFEAIFGADNGVTTPDALHYGLYLDDLYPSTTYLGFIEDEYRNATFHPKVYEFIFQDEVISIIGSANLTGGGLTRNGELGVELKVPLNSEFAKQLEKFWRSSRAKATKVSEPHIRRLSKSKAAGDERQDELGGSNTSKPALKFTGPIAPKPLFKKIIDLPKSKSAKKSKLLSAMGSITERPTHLYLQIFERETGGQKGKSGSAVQLPVATLGAYFGLSEDEQREVTFKFPGEDVVSKVIHNSNHTHQVRLSPIFTVVRPAIIHFQRIGEDVYKARFVPPGRYASTLLSKCTEQSRKGARRWGIFP